MITAPRLMFHGVTFDPIDLPLANVALVEWGHKMGALHRPNAGDHAYGLTHNERLVGVVTTSCLCRANVAGHKELTRYNTVELSRVCAIRKDLCRVLVRLWREFVFAELPHPFAISYQDAVLHSGDLYRFDGWKRIGKSHSGTDTRSGRKGRNKVIWGWAKDRDYNWEPMEETNA